MAGAKEIRTKIKSVQNTQKITRAMEMVAASKMRKAQERMRFARPYAERMRTVIAHLANAHPEYRHRPEVIAAGACLKERFFKSDQYNDRKTPAYWLKFQFPFWWANLLTALDSLSLMGFDRDDPDISGGLSWFLSNQSPDGLWETAYGSGKSAARMRAWVGLAVCRMLKRFYGAVG